MKTLLYTALCALIASPAFAQGYTLGDLSIDHVFAYETAPGARTGAGYLTITNTGDTAQRLLAVEAEYPAVQLHLSLEDNGVMRMEQQEAIEIPAGDTVSLAPGGYHVMFMGLDAVGFDVGADIPARMIFEGLDPLEVVFHVVPRGEDHLTMEHGDHDMTDHDMTGHDMTGHGHDAAPEANQ